MHYVQENTKKHFLTYNLIQTITVSKDKKRRQNMRTSVHEDNLNTENNREFNREQSQFCVKTVLIKMYRSGYPKGNSSQQMIIL